MIGEIEDAILKRINLANNSGLLGYKLMKVASYGGEFAEGIAALVRQFPAVLVLFGGMREINSTNTRTQYRATYLVAVGAKSLRNESESRLGKDAKPGSYQIVEDMCALLRGQKLGVAITPMKVTSVRALSNDRANNQLASIYGIDIETTFWADDSLTIDQLNALNPDGQPIGDFQTLHVNWDVAPAVTPAPTLPDDEKANATDHIEMET